eukprot:6299125-Alexandrium_andersonii.AAC.1
MPANSDCLLHLDDRAVLSWPDTCEPALPGLGTRRQRTRGLSSSRAARILHPRASKLPVAIVLSLIHI